MKTMRKPLNLVVLMILLSALLKLYIALTMPDKLFVWSDDLGYIKSAKLLLETGTLSFHERNVPTVWITPAYPLFLAPFYWLFSDFAAIQAVRVTQILLSSLTIWVVYLLGKRVHNTLTGLIAAALVAFYPPNLLTANLLLTETLFTLLLVWFLYLSLDPAKKTKTFIWLGAVWAITSLVRPTIAAIPGLFFLYYLVTRKLNLWECLKYGTIMLTVGILIFSPWWVRNYIHYEKFIPFTYAEGAPLLEGSYLNGEVDRSVFIEENMDKIYVNEYYKQLATERIKQGFREDFWTYLKWYAVEKPLRILLAPFYWIFTLNIHVYVVAALHNLINIGALIGCWYGVIRRKSVVAFLAMTVVYFTTLYSIYFAFSRYGFPQFTLVSILAAYGLAEILKQKELGTK